MINKKYAFCGLNCDECEAKIATVKNDNNLRIKVAAEWSKMNNFDIKPEFINCLGCRQNGVKTMFCDSLCEIRKCCIKQGFESCGECQKMGSCEVVKMIIGHNENAKKILEKIQKK